MIEHRGQSQAMFPTALDPRTYYASPTHEEALARLEFLVNTRQRLGLLLGGWGLGKSLVLELFARQLRDRGVAVAHVNLLGSTDEELLVALAIAWGVGVELGWTTRRLTAAIDDRLAECWYLRRSAVVLADDAGEATPAALTQLARLIQRPAPHAAQPTLVLAARAETLPNLGRRLLELAELRVELKPWDAADLTGYLRTALENSGRTQPTFEASAIEHLHALTQGVPRAAQQIANLAVLAALGSRQPTIDIHTLEAVIGELSVAAC